MRWTLGKIVVFWDIQWYFGEIRWYFVQILWYFGQIRWYFGQICCYFGQIRWYFGQIRWYFGEIRMLGARVIPPVSNSRPHTMQTVPPEECRTATADTSPLLLPDATSARRAKGSSGPPSRLLISSQCLALLREVCCRQGCNATRIMSRITRIIQLIILVILLIILVILLIILVAYHPC